MERKYFKKSAMAAAVILGLSASSGAYADVNPDYTYEYDAGAGEAVVIDGDIVNYEPGSSLAVAISTSNASSVDISNATITTASVNGSAEGVTMVGTTGDMSVSGNAITVTAEGLGGAVGVSVAESVGDVSESGNTITVIDHGTTNPASGQYFSAITGDIYLSDNVITAIADGASDASGQYFRGNTGDLFLSGNTVTVTTGTGDAYGVNIAIGDQNGAVHLDGNDITATSDSGSAYAVSMLNTDVDRVTWMTIDNSTLTASVGADSTGEADAISYDGVASVADGTQDIFNISHSTLNGDIHYATTLNNSENDSFTLDSSVLNGRIYRDVDDAYSDVSAVNASVAMSNNSIWNNTGDSRVNDLSVDHSVINMTGGSIQTDTLEGNDGVITSSYNATTGAYNTLTAGTAAGNFAVNVASSGQNADAALTSAVFVSTSGGDASFTGKSDQGVYQYSATDVANDHGGTDVMMTQSGLSTGARAAVNSRAAAASMWNMENDTLNQRMTSARRDANDKGGVWASYYGGRTTQTAGDSDEYDNDINGFMVGLDTESKADQGGTWLAGVAFSQGHGDLSMTSADGSVDSNSGQAYLSRRFDSGMFVDLSARFTRYSTSQDVVSTDGAKSHGNYDSNGYGASLKTGYTWNLANNLFVEPYVQASAMTMDGVDYTTSNGMQVHDSSYNSVRYEAGADAGINLDLNGNTLKPFVHLAGAAETADGNKMTINGVDVNDSVDGGAFVGGAGVQLDTKAGVGMYARFDYTKGSDTENPWQAVAGVKYTW